MEALDLDIVDGVFIDLNSLGFLQIFLQRKLVVVLDGKQLIQNLFVAGIGKEFFQLLRIRLEAVSD